MSTTPSMPSTTARTVRVVCLTPKPRAGLERPLAHPAERRLERPRGHRLVVRVDEHVAARHVDLVLEADRHGHARASPRRSGRRPCRPRRRGCAGRTAARARRRRPARRRRRPGPRSRGSRGARPTSAGSPTARGSGGRRGCGRPRARSPRGGASSVAPCHHGIRSDGSTTLSPWSAAIGIATSSLTPSAAVRSSSSCSISLNRASSKSTRSILLTAKTRWGTARSDAIRVWRRVCSITPLRASTSTTATSAVEAPVTMLRVYWTWPGRVGELEAALRGDEAAVGDVDRDPLLALGAQPVGEQREVDVAVAAALARLLDVLHLVDEHLLRVEEQAPDQGRLAVVDGAAGDEPEQLGRAVGGHGRDGRIRSSRHASGPPSPPRRRGRRPASRRAR